MGALACLWPGLMRNEVWEIFGMWRKCGKIARHRAITKNLENFHRSQDVKASQFMTVGTAQMTMQSLSCSTDFLPGRPFQDLAFTTHDLLNVLIPVVLNIRWLRAATSWMFKTGKEDSHLQLELHRSIMPDEASPKLSHQNKVRWAIEWTGYSRKSLYTISGSLVR